MFSRYEAAALSLLPVIGMASDGYGDRAIMVVMMVRSLIPRAGLCVCVVKYGSCWQNRLHVTILSTDSISHM